MDLKDKYEESWPDKNYGEIPAAAGAMNSQTPDSYGTTAQRYRTLRS